VEFRNIEMPYSLEDVDRIDGTNPVKIKVIGVGGGGTNMINHMARENNLPIHLIAVNSDIQHLSTSLATTKVQIGEKLTRGLGAGANPEIGRDSANESAEEIQKALEGADIVFVATGLGGGTGTGAAPVVAKIAKELGALTIAVTTTPFKYEGRKREKVANLGLEELKNSSDSIVVIPNNKLRGAIDKSVGFKDAFRIIDDVLSRAVNGMSGVVLEHGESDINVDFADMRTVMSYKGKALMGIGEANGENAAMEAIQNAIKSPLLNEVDLDRAKGILIHFTIHPNYPYMEVEDSMDLIYDSSDEDADVFFGTTTNDELEENFVKVILIATGFEHDEIIQTQGSTQKEFEEKQKISSHTRPTSNYNNQTQTTQNSYNHTKQQPKTEEPNINSAKERLSQLIISEGNETNIDDIETPAIFRKKRNM
jgi:cell division protein FtsZ